MAVDDDQPATKGDLREVREELRQLRQDVGEDIRKLREEVGEDIGRALAIQREEFQAWARTFDDKYKDLPGRVAILERDVAKLTSSPPSAPQPARRRKKSAR